MNQLNKLSLRHFGKARIAITLTFIALLSACGATQNAATPPVVNSDNIKLTFNNNQLKNVQSLGLGSARLQSRNVGFTQSETGSLALGLAIPLFGAAANAAYVSGITEDKGKVLSDIAKLDLAAISSQASSSICNTATCEIVDDTAQADLSITPAISMLLALGDKDLSTKVFFFVSNKSDPKWQGRYMFALPENLNYEMLKNGDNSQLESHNTALANGYKHLLNLLMQDLQGKFNYASEETIMVENADNQIIASGKLLQQDGTLLIIDTYHGIRSIDVSDMKVRKI